MHLLTPTSTWDLSDVCSVRFWWKACPFDVIADGKCEEEWSGCLCIEFMIELGQFKQYALLGGEIRTSDMKETTEIEITEIGKRYKSEKLSESLASEFDFAEVNLPPRLKAGVLRGGRHPEFENSGVQLLCNCYAYSPSCSTPWSFAAASRSLIRFGAEQDYSRKGVRRALEWGLDTSRKIPNQQNG